MQPMQGSTWRGRAAGVVLAALALGGGSALADAIYVATCGDDAWTGASPDCQPPDGPKATIQAAIDAAMDGDEIAVAPGTYNEAIDFFGKAVRLYSTDGPEVTIIDAGGESGAGSVVTCESGEGPDTVLEGFTITGGLANQGGGMYVADASPTVTGCVFRNNEAGSNGGGVYCNGGATFTACRLEDNHASVGTGGGMKLRRGTARDCLFARNRSEIGGGGMWLVSGIVVGCRFEENVTKYWGGGGIWVGGLLGPDRRSEGRVVGAVEVPLVLNCTFVRNTGEHGPGGGGVAFTDAWIIGCSFLDNEGSHAGGLGISTTSRVVIANCTFTRNAGGGVGSDSGGVMIQNSIVWDNSPYELSGGEPLFVVRYSDVRGGWPGQGNIDADPLCDEDGRPQAGSPCSDAGANNAVPADLLDLDEDGDRAERLSLDLGGNPRFADTLDMEDTGCGEPVQVDMGAYEYQGVPWHPMLVGDVDGDGIVGFSDLLETLSAWGPCDPECCLADIDFSWAVDFDDLLIVLDNWS